MTMKATAQIMIYLGQFINIDLFSQGYYTLKVGILKYDDKVQKHQYAQPYNILSYKNKSLKQLNFFPTIQDNHFYSQVFYIRYIGSKLIIEQQIKLYTACNFRFQLDAYPYLDQDNIQVQIQLLYFNTISYRKEMSQTNFKTVSKASLALSNLRKGVFDYSPIFFDQTHFCKLEVIAFSLITCKNLLQVYKFRRLETQKIQKIKIQPENAELYKLNQRSEIKNFIAFFSFATDKGDSRLINQFYLKYVKYLRMGVLQFSKQIIEFIRKMQVFLDHKQKFRLIMPGFDNKTDFQICNLQQMVEYKQQYNKYSNNSQTVSQFHIEGLCSPNNLLQQMGYINQKAFFLWHQIHKILQKIKWMNQCPLFNVLGHKFKEEVRNITSEFVFKSQQANIQKFRPSENNSKSFTLKASNLRKKQPFYYNLGLRDLKIFPNKNTSPIIFAQKQIFKQYQQPTVPLVYILVHGFQGSSYDMRLIYNYVKLINPKGYFLKARSNEINTNGDIGEMGRNLADEIIHYIKIQNLQQFRFVFIGHSMGGVIIRAALPHLDQYKNNMYSLITMSSPHLGYINNQNKLVDFGMWVWKKWKVVKSLDQLGMTDADKYQNSFMYKLSMKDGINWFTKITLFSSSQDGYCPWSSGRLQLDKGLSNKGYKVYKTMLQNLFSNSKLCQLNRMQVNFQRPAKSKDLQWLIGRTAHIMFLDNEQLYRILNYSNDKIFK